MAGAPAGGAETFFVDLVSALARTGLDQRIAIRADAARAKMLFDAGLAVGQLRFGGLFDLGTRRALRAAFESERPSIVQSWMSRATQHCPRTEAVRVGWLGGYYPPRVVRHCDHVVGVTPDIVRHLREGGFAEERCHYLPTFATAQPAAAVSRASLDTPEGVPLVLALGRLHGKKGLDVLLRALAKVRNAWLWIAGEGPLRAELTALCTSLGLDGRVRFLGWRTDREALLAACDVSVMPSRYEPFGTVMIETWAARRPLIAAAAAGPKGLVRDGIDALLVPIDDVDALAGALERVLGEPTLAAALAAEGFAVYQQRFTEAAVVRQYLDFYKRISA
ncbi:MAG: glycosyltransferase [Alphaproteobacteria bacterium]|nr:glycosyltransferase [Alphaproteobacteria bacterium]